MPIEANIYQMYVTSNLLLLTSVLDRAFNESCDKPIIYGNIRLNSSIQKPVDAKP